MCETGQYVSTDVVVDFITQRASYEKAMDMAELSYPKTLKTLEEHRKTIALKKDQASKEAKKSMNINTYNEYSSKIKEKLSCEYIGSVGKVSIFFRDMPESA